MSGTLDRRAILGLQVTGLGDGAQAAERAGLDFVFLGDRGDGPVGCDPLSVAAYLMTTTAEIGLVASVPTSWAPFNVARALASFDRLSGGRCGWTPHIDAAEIDPAREAEHLDVVLKLFDSWDDDALVLDKASSIFTDASKVRRIEHEGVYFSVDGPLNAPRPLQGWPVLMQPIAPLSPTADIALLDLEALDDTARKRAGSAKLLAMVEVSVSDATGTLAERLAGLFLSGVCDGFIFNPADPSSGIPMLTEQLIPGLRAAGLPANPAAKDFRTRLGLPRPANRYAKPAVAEVVQ